MKLNLRDFFWLILVAAVLTLWWMDHTKLTGRIRALETPADPFGGGGSGFTGGAAGPDPFGNPFGNANPPAGGSIDPTDPFK
jgi:hypothetical protein